MSNSLEEQSRLSRLITLLTLLQSKQVITAATLAERFGVSVRTIYRDIRTLEQAGVPIVAEERKGYSLMEGYKLPPVMFTEEEANAMVTMEMLAANSNDASLQQQYRTAVEKVRAVLQWSGKEKIDRLSERISLSTPAGPAKSNTLMTIQKCITDRLVLKLVYTASGGVYSERTVEPLAVYLTNTADWVMIAWCRLRGNYREFRLDRIQTLQRLDEDFPPRFFRLDTYFAEQ